MLVLELLFYKFFEKSIALFFISLVVVFKKFLSRDEVLIKPSVRILILLKFLFVSSAQRTSVKFLLSYEMPVVMKFTSRDQFLQSFRVCLLVAWVVYHRV